MTEAKSEEEQCSLAGCYNNIFHNVRWKQKKKANEKPGEKYSQIHDRRLLPAGPRLLVDIFISKLILIDYILCEEAHTMFVGCSIYWITSLYKYIYIHIPCHGVPGVPINHSSRSLTRQSRIIPLKQLSSLSGMPPKIIQYEFVDVELKTWAFSLTSPRGEKLMVSAKKHAWLLAKKYCITYDTQRICSRSWHIPARFDLCFANIL